MDLRYGYLGLLLLGTLLGTSSCSRVIDDESGATGEDGTTAEDGTADGTGDGGTADGGTADDDGTDDDGTGDDGTDDDGTDGDDGTTGGICEEYAKTDDDFGPAVSVTIRNSRPDPIYVPTERSGGTTPFYLSNESGTLYWAPHFDCDTVTCAELMSGICEGACPGCYCGEAVKMASGATYEAIWPGTLYEHTELPAACNLEDCEWGLECAKPYGAPGGAYTASSVAYTVLDCDQGSCPDCDPGDGWCIVEIDMWLYAGEELHAEAQVDYPNATTLELTFE